MSRRVFHFQARDKQLTLGLKTRLMAVINVTPDSFSDGGRFLAPERAVVHALQLAQEGADILDIGGESTRPGAKPVSAQQEMDRILPVLESLIPQVSCLISVDTNKSEVAREALRLGAHLINDVSGLKMDPAIAVEVSRRQAGIVLVHMKGTPATMQRFPCHERVLEEVAEGLKTSLETARTAGIPHDKILLDPGIGFGKTVEGNLAILNNLAFLADFDLPILIGTSRKSFIGKILGVPADQRFPGTLASSLAAAMNGAHVLRVHEVQPLRQALKVLDSILAEKLVE